MWLDSELLALFEPFHLFLYFDFLAIYLKLDFQKFNCGLLPHKLPCHTAFIPLKTAIIPLKSQCFGIRHSAKFAQLLPYSAQVPRHLSIVGKHFILLNALMHRQSRSTDKAELRHSAIQRGISLTTSFHLHLTRSMSFSWSFPTRLACT